MTPTDTPLHTGGSGTWLDYILAHQLEAIRPKSAVDFGAGAGKNGMLLRGVLGVSCRRLAVEGFAPTAAALRDAGVYDEVHQALLQDWLRACATDHDLAIFGDVLEHLRPRTIHRAIRDALRHFRELIIVVPLCHLMQDTVDGNPLEIHRGYLTRGFFDRYEPVEKHIVRAGHLEYMNVRLARSVAGVPSWRRWPRHLYHGLMVVLQPVGLARPLNYLFRHYFNKFKWLIHP